MYLGRIPLQRWTFLSFGILKDQVWNTISQKFKEILQFLIHLPQVHNTLFKSCKFHGAVSSRNEVIAC